MESKQLSQINMSRFFHSSIVASFVILSSWNLFAQTSTAKQWVGTWACAPYALGSGNTPPAVANNTVRQVVRVSIGGDTIRVKFSNKTCGSAVTMKSVNVAVSPDGTKSAITASTIKQLQFNGSASITLNAGATATSDPVAFELTPSMRVAITIYYGSAGNGTDMTGHVGARTDSYVLSGDQTANAAFSGATVTAHWLTISAIDVLTSQSAAAVAALGNSITDGYGLSGGLQNRWTDAFSEKLLKNAATAQVGVLNLGIGATNVAGAGATTGASRYQQDILNQSGVKWVIIYYGINDINGGASATTITDAYKKMITDGHAKNLKVFGATITPVNGHSYYSTAHESVRSAVNKWIRAAGNFDGCIDFDKTIRNPTDTTRMQAAYANDYLHPNAAGYKFLGESIDPKLFALDDLVINVKVPKGNADGVLFSNYVNGAAMITFEIPRETFVSLKVYSLHGKEIAELAGKKFSSGRHTVEFKGKNRAQGMYVYSIKAGRFSASRKMIVPVH